MLRKLTNIVSIFIVISLSLILFGVTRFHYGNFKGNAFTSNYESIFSAFQPVVILLVVLYIFTGRFLGYYVSDRQKLSKYMIVFLLLNILVMLPMSIAHPMILRNVGFRRSEWSAEMHPFIIYSMLQSVGTALLIYQQKEEYLWHQYLNKSTLYSLCAGIFIVDIYLKFEASKLILAYINFRG